MSFTFYTTIARYKSLHIFLYALLKNNAKQEDYALIQGDMGATYQIINYCFSIGIITCYTTTKRVSIQEKNNNGTVNVIKEFKHERYRIYEKSC